MNAWGVTYTPEARLDLLRLDKSQRGQAQKAIDRVSRNPLPNTEGGYGKPLRGALSGCMKIKLLRLGFASCIVCTELSTAWKSSSSACVQTMKFTTSPLSGWKR